MIGTDVRMANCVYLTCESLLARLFDHILKKSSETELEDLSQRLGNG